MEKGNGLSKEKKAALVKLQKLNDHLDEAFEEIKKEIDKCSTEIAKDKDAEVHTTQAVFPGTTITYRR